MRNYLIAIGLLLPGLILAQGKLNPEQTSTKWIKNTSITLAYSTPDSASFAPERHAGKNWLFEYTHLDAEYAGMADDEKTEIIGFELDPVKGNQFIIKGAQLTHAHAYYMLGCFCKDRGFKLIKDGYISGKKLSPTIWLITCDVTIGNDAGGYHKKFTRKFTLHKN